MATILEEGHYPKSNTFKCEECHCYFAYYNSEVTVDMTTPDEEALLGGFGVHKYVRCPQCNAICTISTQFTEHESSFSKLIDKIRNIFKKKGE